MPKLFVFGIGGTGARVIKSLTMLLATGLTTKDYHVIPILVDPHESLQEQNNCKRLLKLYADIHEAAYKNASELSEGFFKTPLSTLAAVAPGTKIKDGFGMEGNYSTTFGQFIQRNNFPENSQTSRFLSLLYSQNENFNKSLSMGFKGNPNVGSVVLNTIQESPVFNAFERTFGKDDRIFIVSSIFGGTGAAGFPLLLKILRQHSNDMIKDAKIGALTVMPYFKLSKPDESKGVKSDIDSRNFLTKTKAALSYYITNIKDLNAIYYLADPYEQSKIYENNEQTQPDMAHLIEMLGALSIIDFSKHDFPEAHQQVFEYGLKKNEPVIHFKNLGDETTEMLAPALTGLILFQRLHKEIKKKKTLPFRKTNDFDTGFFDDLFFSNLLEDFLDHYFEPWINELAANQRSFSPFNERKGDDFSHWIKEYKPHDGLLPGLITRPFDTSDLFVRMAKKERKYRYLNKINKKSQYLSMAYNAIRKSIEKNLTFSSHGE